MEFIRKALAEGNSGSGQQHVTTDRYDPYKGFNFEVAISGDQVFARAGFKKVTGLIMNTDVVEYREGGDNLTVSKSPGLTKFEPITMERGISEDMDMWNWAGKIFDIANETQTTKYRANMKITLRDREGVPRKAWEIPNCWISKFQTSDFDAMESTILLETIEVQHEGFTQVPV